MALKTPRDVFKVVVCDEVEGRSSEALLDAVTRAVGDGGVTNEGRSWRTHDQHGRLIAAALIGRSGRILASVAAGAGHLPHIRCARPRSSCVRRAPASDASPPRTMGDASAPLPSASDASLPSSPGLDARQTLVPDKSWACGMPEGIPGPLTGQSAFVIDFEVGQERDVGETPFGRRRLIDVRGGNVSGAKVTGSVQPGGLEYELTLDNGVVELEQIHVLKLGDQLVFMRNCGVAPDAATPGRIVLGMEAAKDGAYAFLNEGRYVATRVYEPASKRLRLEVYQMVRAGDAANAVRITKPAGRPHQSWECKKGPSGQGPEVYQATVAVSTEWWTVGDSKYGTRNIIPIVGGTMSGKLKGRVLPGGADYQIIVGDFALDARYTLQTEDNALIIVRNCGVLGALVPTFETRRDGPYAWLNQGAFLSADPLPSLDLSEIYLTIYEAR